MRKNVLEITCDDCGRSLTEKDAIRITGMGDECVYADFCMSCVNSRVYHSVAIVALNRICKKCKGKGKVKEGYGPHNDFNWVFCTVCEGKKVMPLVTGGLVRGKK